MSVELRRRRMMEDMRDHREEDEIVNKQMKAHQNHLLNDMCRKFVTSLAILLLLGILAILHFRPKIIFKERLPRRTLMTVYPDHLRIRQKLPSFIMGYALVDESNENERAAVKRVASMRRILSDPGHSVRQKIVFNAWEHVDFALQMIQRQPGAMDHFCGNGYQELYQRYRADDLLFICMLRAGGVDGYVKYHLEIKAPLVRGTRGVAAQYYLDEKRISSEFLLLPIRSNTTDHHAASTVLPLEMTKYVLATNYEYTVQEYEEFLYKVVTKEKSNWEILTAACNESDRQTLEHTQRLVATSCTESTSSPDCCSFYDPRQKPYVARVRREDDDE